MNSASDSSAILWYAVVAAVGGGRGSVSKGYCPTSSYLPIPAVQTQPLPDPATRGCSPAESQPPRDLGHKRLRKEPAGHPELVNCVPGATPNPHLPPAIFISTSIFK